ncbi:hypothetical protein BDV06DRAFT_221646 [Aspergillus oleicola]
MPCDAHHWYTMCAECKDKAKACIDTGMENLTYIPRLSTLQPEQTTPVIFDLEVREKDLDIETEGHMLGSAVQNHLRRFIMVGDRESMRFHMWFRTFQEDADADTNTDTDMAYDDEGEESDEEAGPAARTRSRSCARTAPQPRKKRLERMVHVSVLVDVPSKRPPVTSMLQSLPTNLMIGLSDGVDTISFDRAWTVRPQDGFPKSGIDHPGKYRLDWFSELLESSAPYLVWSNLPLHSQVNRGGFEQGDLPEHSMYKAGR